MITSSGPTPSIYTPEAMKPETHPESWEWMCSPPVFYFCAVFPWHLARASTSVMSRGFMRPSKSLGFYADLNRKPTQGNALSVCRPNSQDAFTRVPRLEQNKGLAQQIPCDPEKGVPSPPRATHSPVLCWFNEDKAASLRWTAGCSFGLEAE